jgi:N-acetylglucosamine transport system permease protein
LFPAYVLSILWSVFTLYVIGWIIAASLSTTREIFTGKLLQSGLHFKNFQTALVRNKALWNLLNSVIYTVPSCIFTILISAPAAYCLGRFKFRGNGLVLKAFLICLSIPQIMIIMPLFSIVNQLNLSGNRMTLIVIYTATAVPYTVYFLITFFRNIPSSFEESATIDGCSPVKCFWYIIFPLAQPALVTITIFNFIRFWNEYFIALIFANKPKMRPLGVGLYQTVQSMMNSGDWAGMFASVVIVFIPTVIIYIFLSERIISDVAAGGIKG